MERALVDRGIEGVGAFDGDEFDSAWIWVYVDIVNMTRSMNVVVETQNWDLEQVIHVRLGLAPIDIFEFVINVCLYGCSIVGLNGVGCEGYLSSDKLEGRE